MAQSSFHIPIPDTAPRPQNGMMSCPNLPSAKFGSGYQVVQLRRADPDLDPQDLFVDFIYAVSKPAVGPILLFLGLNAESLEHLFQTSKTVDERLLGVLYHILGSADK